MGIEIFLFALLVFGMVLVILAMVLYAKKQREETMSEEEYNEKEQKLMLLYFEVEDMLNGLKEYVEHSRELLGLEFDRLQAQTSALTTAAGRGASQEQAAHHEPAEYTPVYERTEVREEYSETPEVPDKQTLYEVAKDMLRSGAAPARIAEELHLSRSEITFIQKLI